MSDYQGWTVEEHEQINSFNVLDHELGQIIRGMQQTDDDAWLHYVQYIREKAIASLDFLGQQFLLEKYLDIQVFEDRDQLDSASKPLVRSLFADWAEIHRQTEQGGPGTASRFAKMIPRFNYCLYVDQACLDTLLAREEWERERERKGDREQEIQERGMPPDVICAIIDTDCEPGGEGQDGYEPIEGCTRYFPGWMYCIVDLLNDLYDRLHVEELIDGYESYERPPGVPNAREGGQRMPL